MIRREQYSGKIKSLLGTPLIKVITGMRRSGKSTILELLKDDLLKADTRDSHILHINYESLRYESLRTYDALYSHVSEWAEGKSGRLYILLDEVQEVEKWEKVVSSLLVDFDCDIIVTGSNARLLSSELSTLIAGRYIEIKVYPLSFFEYKEFRSNKAEYGGNRDLFEEYLRFGGLPGIHEVFPDAIPEYIRGIYDTIILRDVIIRNEIRNADLLERITYFLMDNVGNIFSAKSIGDFLKSQRRSVGAETVYNYLNMLMAALFVHKAPRYDVKGKRHLETLEKYYLTDHGIKSAILGYDDRALPGLLENIVYVELLRRGYRLSVGKIDNLEIDFVAEKENEMRYFQVTTTTADDATLERELRPLMAIADNYPKYVLSLDALLGGNVGGIEIKSIINFLLEAS